MANDGHERSGHGAGNMSVDAPLPPAAWFLSHGGDTRIALTPDGSNRYGCPPTPDPAVAPFGSSTASTVSVAGFTAAEALRGRLQAAAGREPQAQTYERELARIRGELVRLCGLEQLSGLEIVFSASGTDLHLIAAQLAASASSAP